VSGLRGAPHTLLGDSEAAVAAGQKARDRNLTIGGTFKCGGLPDGLNIQFDRAETHTNMSDLALLTGRDDTGIATVMEAGLDAERAIQGARRTVKAVVRDAVFSHGFLVKIGKDIGAHTGRIAGRIHAIISSSSLDCDVSRAHPPTHKMLTPKRRRPHPPSSVDAAKDLREERESGGGAEKETAIPAGMESDEAAIKTVWASRNKPQQPPPADSEEATGRADAVKELKDLTDELARRVDKLFDTDIRAAVPRMARLVADLELWRPINTQAPSAGAGASGSGGGGGGS
jgi:hypothetical protein